MTDAVLNIVLTDAGMAAVAAAHGQGVQAKITHVAIGDVGHAASNAATALASEKARVALAAGGPLGVNQVLLQGLFPAGGPEFFIREMGYFLEDGTLLGIWSDPVTPLGWVGGTTPWFFKFAFAWTALPDNAVTVLIADDAGQAGMALDLSQLESKVRHTVEASGQTWDQPDNTQLTDAINTLIETALTAVFTLLGAKAPIESPEFTGLPRVPTAAPGTSTSQAASTAYVVAQLVEGGYAKLANANAWLKAQRSTPVVINDGAPAIDLSASNVFAWTLGGSRTLPLPTSVGAGQSGVIWLTQGGAGGWAFNYNTFWQFPGGRIPVVSTAAGAKDCLVYEVNHDGTFALCALLKGAA